MIASLNIWYGILCRANKIFGDKMKKITCILAVISFLMAAGCSGGSGNTPASSDSKQITLFEITSPVAASGIIDESAKTIAVEVPYGTDLSALIVQFVTTGVKTTVDGVEQESSKTSVDFTKSVAYIVDCAGWNDGDVYRNGCPAGINRNDER